MKTFDQKTVTERFAKLPEKVKDIILSESTTESIHTITATANLEGENKKKCIEQITLVSTGLATTKDFKGFVDSELSLSPVDATKLYEGVVQYIFSPVREALIDSLGKKTDNKEESSAPNTPSTKETVSKNTDPYKEQLV